MEFSREKVRSTFKEYTDRYNSDDPKIRLKINHTYRVAAICDRIADSLSLSPADKNLAWLTGMLHDIGRFEQIRRYGTFNDALSVNHARFGADLLFKEGLVEQYLPAESFAGKIGTADEDPADNGCTERPADEDPADNGCTERPADEDPADNGCAERPADEGEMTDELPEDARQLLELAIRHHSDLNLPEMLTDREKQFCQIIRDADKVDIFRVNMEVPMEDIYNMPRESFASSRISPAVYNRFMEERCIDRRDRETPADYVVSHIALAFELVYPVSREIAREQGYVLQMLDFEFTDPDSAAQFEKMKAKMLEFLQQGNQAKEAAVMSRADREEAEGVMSRADRVEAEGVMSRADRAEAYFLQGYNCSQSVFAAFADRYGISEEQALKLTSTLGAGVSSMREVCGAVSAMSMVCGLEEGNSEAGTALKKAAYEANRKHLDAFSEQWGSIVCRDILKMRADQKRQAPSERTAEYYKKRPCLAVVRSAAEILAKAYGED